MEEIINHYLNTQQQLGSNDLKEIKKLLFTQSYLQSIVDNKLRNLWEESRINNNIDLKPNYTSFNLIQSIHQFLFSFKYSNNYSNNIDFNINCDSSIVSDIVTDENWLQSCLGIILNNNIITNPYCEKLKINISIILSNNNKSDNYRNNNLLNSFNNNNRVEPYEEKLEMIIFEIIPDNNFIQEVVDEKNDDDELIYSIDILEKPKCHGNNNINKTDLMKKRIEILGGYCNYKQVNNKSMKSIISFVIPYNFEKVKSNNNVIQQHEDEKSNVSSIPKSSNESVISELSNNTGIVRLYNENNEYLFPIDEIPVVITIPKYLNASNFKDVKQIKNGSHSIIFHTNYNNKESAIKMLMVKRESSLLTISEFDIEINILMRISHPNIIRIFGAGTTPKMFYVMEWLGGGTLADLMETNKTKNSYNKPNNNNNNNNNNMVDLYSRNDLILAPFEKDMFVIGVTIAKIMLYLHYECFDGLSIIFRDLKPDNIGFTSDGTIKLFDFGLITCIKRNQNSNEEYELSGPSGSVIYMAPEVALGRKYNEKVDVYSFGVLLYEMLSNEPFFSDYSDQTGFIERVIINGDRPLIPRHWPILLQHLIADCWNPNPVQRPSFDIVVNNMELIKKEVDSYDSSNLLFNFVDMC